MSDRPHRSRPLALLLAIVFILGTLAGATPVVADDDERDDDDEDHGPPGEKGGQGVAGAGRDKPTGPSFVPRNIQANPHGAQSILITWEAPLPVRNGHSDDEDEDDRGEDDDGDDGDDDDDDKNTPGAIVGYEIFQLSPGIPLRLGATGSSEQTFIASDLESGTEYTVSVRAIYRSGPGPFGDSATASPAGLPGPPRGLQAAAGPSIGTISLSWDAPESDGGTGIETYEIKRDGTTNPLATVSSDVMTFEDTGLAQGSTHSYTVRAVNGAGAGPASNTATATTFDVPGSPQTLEAHAGPGAGAITLQWSAPNMDGGQAITAYHVYREDTVPIATLDSATFTYVDAGLNADTTYGYAVTASNAVGEGPQSPAQTARTFAAPGTPAGLTAYAGPGADEITIDWVAPDSDGGSGITAFIVESSNDLSGWTVAGETGAAERTFTDSGLGSDETRHYRVRAMNDVGTGPPSSPVNATSFDVPDPPRAVSAQTGPGSGEITITWQAPAADGGRPVTGYNVYAVESGATPALVASTSGSVHEHVLTGLGPGAEQNVVVTATNDVGESDPSEVATASTFDVPGVPTDLVARSGPERGAIQLSWQTPATDGGRAVTGFTIYRGLVEGELEPRASTVATEKHVMFNDTGNPDGQRYIYRVAAVNPEGEGPLSPLAYGSTFVGEGPAPMPGPRTWTSSVFTGAAGYVFGGASGPHGSDESFDQVFRFDPATETTEPVIDPDTGAPLSIQTPRHGTSAVWVPDANATGRAFVFGGATHEGASSGPSAESCHFTCVVGGDIQVFDPLTVKMQSSTSSIEEFGERSHTSAVYVPPGTDGGDRVFIFGGRSTHNETEPHEHGDDGPSAESCHFTCLVGQQVLIFEPPTWKTSLAGGDSLLPSGRSETAAVWFPAVDDGNSGTLPGTGVVYIFGGHPEGDQPTGPAEQSCHFTCLVGQQILIFNPPTMKTSVVGSMPESRWGQSATTDGRFIYLFGGQGPSGPVDDVVRFDPLDGTLTVIGMLPTDRTGTSAMQVGARSYVFGGDDGDNATSEVVRFTPAAPRNVSATAGPAAGQLVLTWEAPANELLAEVTGYHVYVGADAAAMVRLATLGQDVRNFTETDLGNGITRVYRVSAFSDIGEGEQSGAVAATTFIRPSPPRDLSAPFISPDNVVHLEWREPAVRGGDPEMYYELWRGPMMGSLSLLVELDGEETTFVDDTCGVGNVCRYQIRAVNAVGASAFSNEANSLGRDV